MKKVFLKKPKVLILISVVVLIICSLVIINVLLSKNENIIKKIELVDSYKYNMNVFTQGLELDGQNLFFSSGLYGKSFIGIYDMDNQEIKIKKRIAKEYFAEGLTVMNNEVWLLTWRENKAFVYDKDTFEELNIIDYEGEGWGLASDGNKFYMSDGSNTISIRNKQDFSIENILSIIDEEGNPIIDLNELEFANGNLYANQWHSNNIYEINPTSGELTGTYNATEIVEMESKAQLLDNEEGVLNGIAHIKDNMFYITGKNWSKIYKVIMN